MQTSSLIIQKHQKETIKKGEQGDVTKNDEVSHLVTDRKEIQLDEKDHHEELS